MVDILVAFVIHFFYYCQVLIAAKYGGHDLKLDKDFDFGTTDKERQFIS